MSLQLSSHVEVQSIHHLTAVYFLTDVQVSGQEDRAQDGTT